MLESNSNFFLSFEMNISRLRPTMTPSSSHISFCKRLLSIVSLGDNAKISSRRVSVPVKSIVFSFVVSFRFLASNKTEPKVKVSVSLLSGNVFRFRVVPDFKKENQPMLKTAGRPKDTRSLPYQ